MQIYDARMQIVQMVGVGADSLTPFINPLGPGASSAIITNLDATSITVSTDDTGSPSIAIPTNSYYEFKLSGNQPWKSGAIMFYVSGAVTTQPIVVVHS